MIGWKRIASCAVLVLVALLPGRASAQGAFGRPGVAPFNRPTVSPYINLARGNSSPVLNYYGLVRPQQAFADSINSLQQDVNQNRDLITTGRDSGSAGLLPVTGHAASFLNTSGYFLTNSVAAPRQPGTAPQSRGRTR